jgi:hypothetical protein
MIAGLQDTASVKDSGKDSVYEAKPAKVDSATTTTSVANLDTPENHKWPLGTPTSGLPIKKPVVIALNMKVIPEDNVE